MQVAHRECAVPVEICEEHASFESSPGMFEIMRQAQLEEMSTSQHLPLASNWIGFRGNVSHACISIMSTWLVRQA